MKFAFVAKHRGIWPAEWLCGALGVSRGGFYAVDAILTPDNQGYYGFHKTYAAYYEVIDYNKLLSDAKKRNRIFFDKINLLNSNT